MVIGSRISCSCRDSLEQVVKYFYDRENEDWHLNVHKNGGSVEENVRDTLNSMSGNSIMYTLVVDEELAAFFVKYEDEIGRLCLEGFHILKKYRNEDFIVPFWDLIKRVFEREFYVGIFSKNKLAINHLRRQGFDLHREFSHEGKEYCILHIKL